MLFVLPRLLLTIQVCRPVQYMAIRVKMSIYNLKILHPAAIAIAKKTIWPSALLQCPFSHKHGIDPKVVLTPTPCRTLAAPQETRKTPTLTHGLETLRGIAPLSILIPIFTYVNSTSFPSAKTL